MVSRPQKDQHPVQSIKNQTADTWNHVFDIEFPRNHDMTLPGNSSNKSCEQMRTWWQSAVVRIERPISLILKLTTLLNTWMFKPQLTWLETASHKTPVHITPLSVNKEGPLVNSSRWDATVPMTVSLLRRHPPSSPIFNLDGMPHCYKNQ